MISYHDLTVIREWPFGYARFEDGSVWVSVWSICLALDIDPLTECYRINALYPDCCPLCEFTTILQGPPGSSFFLPAKCLDEWLDAIISSLDQTTPGFYSTVEYITEISRAYNSVKGRTSFHLKHLSHL